MNSEIQPKWQKIVGWVLTVLSGLAFLASAGGKFSNSPEIVESMTKLGFQPDLLFKLAILETACALLYLIPKTSFLGAILLTGYLGGAICTHLRVAEPVIAPVIIGVVVWIGYGLRNPHIIRAAFCECKKKA